MYIPGGRVKKIVNGEGKEKGECLKTLLVVGFASVAFDRVVIH